MITRRTLLGLLAGLPAFLAAASPFLTFSGVTSMPVYVAPAPPAGSSTTATTDGAPHDCLQ